MSGTLLLGRLGRRGLGVVSLLAVATIRSAAAQDGDLEVGGAAPRFSLGRLDGGRVELAELRGRPVVINFWATWCAPCRSEMPELISWWEKNRDLGLEVLAVNLTDQERRKDITRFVEAMKVPFPVLLDERGRVRERYGLVTVPTTVFVDPWGIVRAIHPGPLSRDDLGRGLATILREPRNPVQ